MSALYYVQECAKNARSNLPIVEKSFNYAGYIPGAVHRVSGGTRIVFGFAEIISSVALSILIYHYGIYTNNRELQREGYKLLDFAVHGAANMFRGFVECHVWFHLLCPLYDNFVPEKDRLSYSRSIFKG